MVVVVVNDEKNKCCPSLTTEKGRDSKEMSARELNN